MGAIIQTSLPPKHVQHFSMPAGVPRPQAAELLSSGLQKYVAGDRMGALALWEDCLKKVGLPAMVFDGCKRRGGPRGAGGTSCRLWIQN